MTMPEEQTVVSTARTYAQIAGAAYGDASQSLRTIPEEAWTGPTGCALWDIRTLAGHIVGEAVWFSNLTRGVTRHEAPYPTDLYESLKTLPPAALADRLQDAAELIPKEIDVASLQQLQEAVDMGWTQMPLWQATYVALSEAVYHDWDLHVGRDPQATIPTSWAHTLATGTARFAPMIAQADGIAAAPGTYLLQVGDGVGPITITAENRRLAVEPGEHGTPDVTLSVTADQYVRLVAGRLPVTRALDQGTVTVTGDRSRLVGLNRIFRGIGGG
jgi:uncharacterized protein (TIGR03086 family)